MAPGPEATADIDARVRALEARAAGAPSSAAPSGAPAGDRAVVPPPAAPTDVAGSSRANRDGKDAWDRLGTFMPLVNGLVLALVGWWLTGTVNEAFKRQELQLANAREMRDLLQTLQGADTTLEDAQASAFTLAAFGPPAVPPLIGALAAGGDTRAPAAEAALRVVGLTEPDAVCRPVLHVLDNRSGRFSWLTHQASLRLVADLQCTGSREVLRRYAPLVRDVQTEEQLAPLREALSAFPPVDLAVIEEMRLEYLRAERFGR